MMGKLYRCLTNNNSSVACVNILMLCVMFTFVVLDAMLTVIYRNVLT